MAVFCIAFSRKTETAAAIAPISSTRSRPGTSIETSLCASRPMAAVICLMGDAMLRATNHIAAMPPAAITIPTIIWNSVSALLRSASDDVRVVASAIATDFGTVMMTDHGVLVRPMTMGDRAVNVSAFPSTVSRPAWIDGSCDVAAGLIWLNGRPIASGWSLEATTRPL